MAKDDKPATGYRIFARLLARKGTAEPLLRNEARLELIADAHREDADSKHLADAQLRSTVQKLVSPPGRSASRGAAPLTDLLDESLVGAVSPHSGEVARPLPPTSVEED